MSKELWIRSGIALTLFLIGAFIVFTNQGSLKPGTEQGIVKKEPVAYEILDDSVQVPAEIEAWMDKNVKKEGFYSKATDKETFVLISGGVKKTTGYGISLNDISQENNTITAIYEVIEPTKEEKVENKETNPHMILRFASKDVKIEGKIDTKTTDK